jgi:hypothetical protein
MLPLGKIFLHENGEKCGLSYRIFLHEKWRKIRYMKMEKNPVHENGEKSGILAPKNAGTWRKSCGLPDVPPDYVRRPPRPGKLVEPVLAEEGCRM